MVGAVLGLFQLCQLPALFLFPKLLRGFLSTERRKAGGVTLHCGNSAIQSHSLLRSSLASLLLQQIFAEQLSMLYFSCLPFPEGAFRELQIIEILLVGLLFHSCWLTLNRMKAAAPIPPLSWC